MTTDQLAKLLDRVCDILSLNKQLAAPRVLESILGGLAHIRAVPAGLASLAGLLGKEIGDVYALLDAAERAVAIETKLTSEGTSERIIATLKAVKNHPVVMKIIASRIKGV